MKPRDIKVNYSPYRDRSTHGRNRTAIEGVLLSEHASKFADLLMTLEALASSHESITVEWRTAPFVYVMVLDSRYIQSAENVRFYTSFNLETGELASGRCEGTVGCARRGWHSYARRITGKDDIAIYKSGSRLPGAVQLATERAEVTR